MSYEWQKHIAKAIIYLVYDYIEPSFVSEPTEEYLEKRRQKAIEAYQNDPLLHNRINSVMALITAAMDGGRDLQP